MINNNNGKTYEKDWIKIIVDFYELEKMSDIEQKCARKL